MRLVIYGRRLLSSHVGSLLGPTTWSSSVSRNEPRPTQDLHRLTELSLFDNFRMESHNLEKRLQDTAYRMAAASDDHSQDITRGWIIEAVLSLDLSPISNAAMSGQQNSTSWRCFPKQSGAVPLAMAAFNAIEKGEMKPHFSGSKLYCIPVPGLKACR